MRQLILAFSLTTGLVSSALAMPTAPALTPEKMVTSIAAGHRFNRFDHHHRFHNYKQRHCTKVRTPNGAVNRCKI